VIAYESGVTETVDPVGGSYYVEALTDEIERKSMDYIKKIDEMGGAVKAIEKQFYQSEITESAYQYQKRIESKEQIIVGVNEFRSEDVHRKAILQIDESIRGKQVQRLRKVRKERDGNAVNEGLSRLAKAASSRENLIPHILAAVESYATVGEISDALRREWGEFRS
jgi:methylmalonyl-CoA mutase N-terminal domain/subunit